MTGAQSWPPMVPPPGDSVDGVAAGEVRQSTFVVIDRGHEPPLVSTAPPGTAADGIAAADSPDGDRVAVVTARGLSVPVVAGEWIDRGALVQVGAGGCAILLRAGEPAGRATSTGAPGGLVEVTR